MKKSQYEIRKQNKTNRIRLLHRIDTFQWILNEIKKIPVSFEQIREWKIIEHNKKSFKARNSDLLKVSREKPIGYLPVELLGKDIEKIKKWAEWNKLDYKKFSIPDCNTRSGALYIYHRRALSDLIVKYKKYFIKANVPVQTEDFISFIAKRVVFFEHYPEAHILIGVAFNDKRFKIGAKKLLLIQKTHPSIIHKLVHRKRMNETEKKVIKKS